MPGMPGGAPMDDMSEEEMRADLDSTLSDIKNKRGAVNAEFYVSKNKLEAAKGEMVKSIFDILKNVGVDPTNLESIQAFIQQLETEDPDLLQLFNMAFDALAGAPGLEPEMETGAPGMGMPGEGMSPEGAPPMGTTGLEADMPLPPPPGGGMAPPPASPPGAGSSAVGGQYKNLGNIMPPM